MGAEIYLMRLIMQQEDERRVRLAAQSSIREKHPKTLKHAFASKSISPRSRTGHSATKSQPPAKEIERSERYVRERAAREELTNEVVKDADAFDAQKALRLLGQVTVDDDHQGNWIGRNLLKWASNRGHFTFVRALVEKGVDIKGPGGKEAIDIAGYQGHTDIRNFLAEARQSPLSQQASSSAHKGPPKAVM